MRRHNIEYGFSLVEMLIASLMSCLLFLAVIQATIYINEQVRAQWLFADVQQRIRFADVWLQSHLTLAGYPGCRQYAVLQHSVKSKLNGSSPLFPQFSVLTTDVAKTMIPDAILHRAVPQSDIILLSYVAPISVFSKLPISTKQWSVMLPSVSQTQQLYFIDNCRYGVFAKLTKVGKGASRSILTDIDTRPPDMMPPFHVGAWVREIIYVGFSSRFNQRHDPVTSLYVSTLTPSGYHTEEMIEGVSRMKIHERFVDLRHSIQIHLLINSTERMSGINPVYEFDGSQHHNPDQVYRKEMIISLRLPNVHG